MHNLIKYTLQPIVKYRIELTWYTQIAFSKMQHNYCALFVTLFVVLLVVLEVFVYFT